MSPLQTALDAALTELDLQLPDSARDKLEKYYELLVDWNTRINLTAITNPVEVAQKHFADSLLPLALAGIEGGSRCIDVGTGAGFPGIPLLIAQGDLQMVLLDATNKRLIFIEEVLAQLGLKAKCIHARAENGGQDSALREKFDVVLTRALAPAPVLMELMLPFAAIGGCAISYKGPGAVGEFSSARRAINILGGGPLSIETASLSWGERCLAVVEKVGSTPLHYPRNAGTPAKSPL